MISRDRAIELLAGERFDVAVVGGGATGAGVALDAASRGYSVALLERADYASGTSSRSSKLIHGGLRYLQNFDLGLVREALLERQLMVRLAPHLVKPLAIVVATFDGARPDRMTGIGLNMYDVMATPWRGRYRVRGRRARRTAAPAHDMDNGTEPTVEELDTDWSPARHRVISGDEVLELLPALSGREPTGGYLFYDCQTDDSRLVLTILGEAERFGAICANRLEVFEVCAEDSPTGPGVRARDMETGTELTVRADNVVNATGVWADRLRPEELHSEAEVPTIVPSRGTHLILAREDAPMRAGAIVPAGEGRSVFALPWLGRTLVGTTDDNHTGDIEHVPPAPEDIAYLLEAVNSFFGTALAAADLCGAYAGVRPLISAGDARKSVDISRKAELYETSSGMITITGGKLTTWRRMAKLAVDRLVERDGREAPCRTHEIPLGEPVRAEALPRVASVSEESYRALADRYGHAAEQVLETALERAELAEQIIPGMPDLLAEAAFSARHEQARRIGDVLLRRTRLGLIAGREVCAPDSTVPLRVARALGSELGWDGQRIGAELRRFAEEATSEGIAALPAT
jgi:glycerol-3-phosphate dehydrogenase